MKLYVIDGNSLLFRAYYATSFTGNIMRRKDGFPTNAIFGLSNMITKIVSLMDDDDLIFVSFDYGKKTFRSELLESYKAQRKPIDEDLKVQLPCARELLKAMNIFYYEVEGYEGDDIAGTVAKIASKQGIETIVYTSDKDYLQLIDDHITIHMIKKGITEVEVMNKESLFEKMNLTPDQIKDYKGLMGDPSDNLKGIPGVGEKTAIKLINEFGSLENILKAMENEDSKRAKNIIENKDLGILCKKMATIVTDMELPFGIKDLTYPGYDYSLLSSFYTKYECYSLAKKLKPSDKRSSTNNTEVKQEKVEIKKNIVKKFKDIPETNIVLIDQEKGNYQTSPINGFAFSSNLETYYLSFNDAKNDKDFIEFMKDSSKKKITYDYKALKVALNQYGIEVNGIEFDLVLATYLLRSDLKNDPIDIYLFHNCNIMEENQTVSLFEDDGTIYSMAYFLEKIYKDVINKLKEADELDLYYKIELPTAEVLAEMEIEGFPVKKEILLEFSKEYQAKCDELTKKIYELGEEEFNLNSPKKLGEILYHKLNLPAPNKKESTDIDALNSIKDLHPIVPLIIEYRKYFKLLSTYTNGLISYIREDNKIHTIFNQALTTTGRLSSSEPNLQNISDRNEEGKRIRKAFYYDDNNYLLSLDYSQIELRIIASMSNCKELIDAFNNDEDIHSNTAMRIFNLTKEEVTPEYRRKAKAINFGIVYGISEWGLGDQIGADPKEAKMIIEKFYETHPEIKDFFHSIIEETIKTNYSKTLFNRRRYIQEINSSMYQVREFGKRAAVNAAIQGTGADIIKLAMIKVNNFLKENNYKTKIICQIHDELIFKIPEEEKDIMVSKLKEIMENVYTLNVKLKVEGSLGKTWYDCK